MSHNYYYHLIMINNDVTLKEGNNCCDYLTNAIVDFNYFT